MKPRMLHVEVTYRGDAEMAAKEIVPIVNEAMEFVARWWHQKILPKHFTTGGGRKYGYAKRGKRYMIRKARVKGHQEPLMWSGDLKRMVTRRFEARSLKTRAQTRVILKGPAHLRRHPRGSGPDMGKELTTTTQGEVDAMARMIDRRVTRKLNNLKGTRTKRIV